MYSLILHGKRLVQLQKCLTLRVSSSSVDHFQKGSSFSNSFSSVATAATAADESLRDGLKGKNFTVSYLVDSMGLAKKLAQSISMKVNFGDKGSPDSVRNLLRSYGFTAFQISNIITEYPRLLIADAEKSLGPKLRFLQSRGASSSELTEIVSKVPKILAKKEGNTISRYYDFVKVILEADKSIKYEKLCHSLLQGSVQENKFRNILVLRELGVPQRFLFYLLTSSATLACGNERFDASLKKVVDMGFDPTTVKFVNALCVFYGLSDKSIEEKVNLFIRLGFDVEDVWEIFKKFPSFLGYSEKKILNSIETYLGLGFTRDEFAMMVKQSPQCIGCSAESVKKKTEFLVKKMKWPLKALVSNPVVIGFSMERRIVPRYNVIKALISKGLITSKLHAKPYVLFITNQAFLNKYVMKYDDKQLVTELIAIFNRHRV